MRGIYELENRMVVDEEWGESEYGVPIDRRKRMLKRQNTNYEYEENKESEEEYEFI